MAAVFLIALALRLPGALGTDRPLVFDERDYDALGRTLARTGAYREDGRPTAYRAPGYPLFLAAVHRLAPGSGPRAARASQAVLDAVSAVLLYWIAFRWGGRAALAAGLLWAVYPPAIEYSRLLYPETLFVLALLSWLLLAGKIPWGRLVPAAAAGAGVGALTLVKTEALLLFAAAPLALGIRRGAARALVFFLLGGAAVLLPWVLRNARVMGAPVLVTSGGPVLLIGNHPNATGGYAPDVPDSMLPRSRGELAGSRESLRSGLRYIGENPARFLSLGLVKIALVFASEAELAVTLHHPAPADSSRSFREKARDVGLLIPALLSAAYGTLLLLGLFGHLAAPTDRITRLSAAILAAWVAAHFVTFGGSRYHQALMPLAALGAGRLLASPRATMASMRPRTWIVLLAAAAALASVFLLEWRFLMRP